MCCIVLAVVVYVVVFDICVSFLDFTSSVVFGCVVSVDHTVDICGGIVIVDFVDACVVSCVVVVGRSFDADCCLVAVGTREDADTTDIDSEWEEGADGLTPETAKE